MSLLRKILGLLLKQERKYDLGILESLVIANTRPKLNIMHNSTELSLFS